MLLGTAIVMLVERPAPSADRSTAADSVSDSLSDDSLSLGEPQLLNNR
jgi:hypothetical protein